MKHKNDKSYKKLARDLLTSLIVIAILLFIGFSGADSTQQRIRWTIAVFLMAITQAILEERFPNWQGAERGNPACFAFLLAIAFYIISGVVLSWLMLL